MRLQHYDCEDVEPLAIDLEYNGYVLTDKLATITELNEESLLSVNLVGFKERRKSTNSRCGKVESEEVVEVIEEEKEG